MTSNAHFSPCRRYRYWLLRVWDETKPIIAFIGLNPSTADETADDPTIRRCMVYAKDWGYGGLLMLNMYGFRSTDPNKMWQHHAGGGDIIGGPGNYVTALRQYCESFAAQRVIAAWGNDRLQRRRLFETIDWKLDCLKKNQDGSPGHPLYLRAALTPQPWNYQP